MNDYSVFVVLCEDRQHEVFMRAFLVSRGIPARRIRVEIALEGRGSGEQYVRRKYPEEVKAYRSKCNYLNIALAVMIDADMRRVVDRLNELDASLAKAELDRRQPNERIGIFVPKRNIETWIHYLMGEIVDEDTAYPKLKKQSECKPLVEELAQKCNQPLEQEAPPSLQAACTELQRIM